VPRRITFCYVPYGGIFFGKVLVGLHLIFEMSAAQLLNPKAESRVGNYQPPNMFRQLMELYSGEVKL
jgi:hypothetical protein